MGKVYCQICNKRCKGDVLKVHDKYIHKTCFLCCCCKTSLERGGFFFKDDKYYCKNDYLENFGVKCKVCNEIAEGEVIVIFATTFHPNCFKCKNCLTIFQRGDKVTLCNGDYLCCNCMFIQTTNLNGKKELSPKEPDETITINKETQPDELDAMTTSMISTNISDSSEAESITPEKKYYYINRNFNSLPRDQNASDAQTMSFLKDEKTGTQSECMSIKSESGYPKTDEEDSVKNFNYRGSISSLKSPTSPMQLGKFYNFSYLSLEEKQKNQFDARSLYRTNRSNITNSNTNIQHFHKIDNFSYRSSPNVTINKRSARTFHFKQVIMDKKPPKTESTPTNESLKTPKPILVNGTNSYTNTEASDGSTSTSTLESSRTTKQQPEERQSISFKPTSLQQPVDPISASRTPNASYEPSIRTRFDRHMFTSPSRQIVPMTQAEFNRMMSADNALKDETRSDVFAAQMSLLTAYQPKPLVTRSQVICNKSTDQDHISVQSFLRSYSREKLTEDRKPKIYSYEQLKISNFGLPKGVDRSHLELHLADDEFLDIFKLNRVAFNRLPEWKRNDLKRRVDLF